MLDCRISERSFVSEGSTEARGAGDKKVLDVVKKTFADAGGLQTLENLLLSSMSSEGQSPVIVLVHTQMGENIGMCARAMLNCGLERLRLVAPRDGWPNERAVATSADADRVIQGVECFGSVAEAVVSDR